MADMTSRQLIRRAKVIEAVVSAGGTAVEIVTQLIQAALSRGGRDNVTAVLARFGD